jgi:acyl-CoA synthetase (AMP-forming)/AMP-acid ligase II
MSALSTAEWPADRSRPILDLTVGDLLRETAAKDPDAVALMEGAPDPEARRWWTYGALLEQSEHAARALAGRFAPGERVAIWANNIPEWVILEFAAAMAGVTIVTVNPALRAEELRHVLGQSRADGIFLVPEYRGTPMAEMLDELRGDLPGLREVVSFADWDEFCASGAAGARLPRVDPGDPAQIQYTSGTTGRPKGAVLHHRGIINNAWLCYRDRLGLGRGLVQLSPMPLFHTAGCAMAVLGSMACEGTLVLPPYFDPGLVLELVESERVQCLLGVPTMLIAYLDHPRFAETDVSSVQCVITGGAVVPPALVRRVETELDARLSIVFAQTESSPVITQTALDDSDEDRATTLGRPLSQTDVKILDVTTGATAPPDVVGEICTRGYHVMTGYFDNAEATAAAIDADGWLHTGDLGSMDARGYCRIGGRLKDMIIRGGENIYPREIEQVLFDHEDVADVAVLGVPDGRWGEQVAAFIRPAEGRTPDPDALFHYCRERLAPFKTPRHWSIVDAFPLTPSGKVQKYVLRQRWLAAGGGVSMTEAADAGQPSAAG